MASTAIFIGPARIGTFDGDDLPALVVTAVRADAMRQLGLAALRTDRPRRRRQLVMGAALATARLRVASFGQRHRCSLLALSVIESRGQIFKGGQARVHRARLTGAGDDVPVAAADGAEPPAIPAAEGLHGEHQRRPGLDQRTEVELVAL